MADRKTMDDQEREKESPSKKEAPPLPRYYQGRKRLMTIMPTQSVNLLPYEVADLTVGGEPSKRLMVDAYEKEEELLLLTPMPEALLRKKQEKADKLTSFSCRMGTVLKVQYYLPQPDGKLRVVIEGLRRAWLEEVIEDEGGYKAKVIDYTYLGFPEEQYGEIRPLLRLLSEEASQLFQNYYDVSPFLLYEIKEEGDPDQLVDKIAAQLDLSPSEYIDILMELDVSKRALRLDEILHHMIEMRELEAGIRKEAEGEMQASQRNYLLREEMAVIQRELGEGGEDPGSLSEDYREKIRALPLDERSMEAVLRECDKLAYTSPMSPDFNVIRSYLDTILDLPWGKYLEDIDDFSLTSEILDHSHFGLKKVKERILEFIAVRQLRKDSKGPILCLVGPPGVGKTSIARAVADSIGREFISMRLGGVSDESEIRGHRRTYVGSMPGRIINQMTRAETMNPVFLFDEIDKIGSDYRGDPASALLEVLDPEQNNAFMDRYLDVPFDLSQVFFITTANTADTIPPALQDRMEIIRIPGYTDDEKFQIGKRFLLKKQREQNGLTARQLVISDKVIQDIIHYYSRESGVRQLERELGKICRIAATRIVSGEESVHVTKYNEQEFLGLPPYPRDSLLSQPQVGVVQGLAWTPFGGEILHIEVGLMEGRGSIQLTGQVGDVMRESVQIAVSYVRQNAHRYGIEDGFFDKYDIHVHMPEGAIPKDGPSAGLAIVTGLVSALTNRPVRSELAMTGEITLLGRLLAVGGIKEKVMVARRYGISHIFLPRQNMRMLDEMEPELIQSLSFIPVETIDEVISQSLLEPVQKKEALVFQSEKPTQQIGFSYRPRSQGQGSSAYPPAGR